MEEKTGRFIMVDGIAGSGKSTIAAAIIDWAKNTDQRVFSLKDWYQNHTNPPKFEEISEHDVFVTFEPTRSWVGSAIRFELSQIEQPYEGTALAHAFALDRQIQYRRLIIPALQAGKTIIQDRGVTTSIVYQPIMKNSLTLEQILNLPGNKLALNHAPNHLILTNISPEIAVKRIPGRKEESKGVFAELEMLKKWHQRFHSDWFRELFEKHGTKIHPLDTSLKKEEMILDATKLIEQIIKD